MRVDEKLEQLKVLLEWIDRMLSYNELRLKDVPGEVRTDHSGLYTTALRISNGVSNRRFISDLTILCFDINLLREGCTSRERLISVLRSKLAINNYEGDEEFEEFKKEIPENILSELRGDSRERYENICTQLTEQGVE
jgi:hypothetical protein